MNAGSMQERARQGRAARNLNSLQLFGRAYRAR
jgi:hypothetical protein